MVRTDPDLWSGMNPLYPSNPSHQPFFYDFFSITRVIQTTNPNHAPFKGKWDPQKYHTFAAEKLIPPETWVPFEPLVSRMKLSMKYWLFNSDLYNDFFIIPI